MTNIAARRKPATSKPFRPTVFRAEPGDTCLVKDKTGYSPAKLIDIKIAQHAGETDAFEILLWDKAIEGRTKTLTKAADIVLLNDDRLASLTLNGFGYDFEPIMNDATTRDTTPPLEAECAFANLDLDEQCRALRPHLWNVINEAYPPAHGRLDDFFAGNQHAKEEYGELRDEQVTDVMNAEIKRWYHRQANNALSSFAVDVRCRSLPGSSHDDFVTNVLVPEAIISRCIEVFDLETAPEYDDERRDREALEEDALDEDDERNLTTGRLVATAVRPLSSEDTYARARRKLRLVRRNDLRVDFQRRFEKITAARKRLRNKLGLAPEIENDAEKADRLQRSGHEMTRVVWNKPAEIKRVLELTHARREFAQVLFPQGNSQTLRCSGNKGLIERDATVKTGWRATSAWTSKVNNPVWTKIRTLKTRMGDESLRRAHDIKKAWRSFDDVPDVATRKKLQKHVPY
ncbi:hypothetical protein Q5752_004138 [Cryptotrichosporon argae]